MAARVVQQQGLPAAATREDDVVLSCSNVVQYVPHVDVWDWISATALHAEILINHPPQFREILGSSHALLQLVDPIVCSLTLGLSGLDSQRRAMHSTK